MFIEDFAKRYFKPVYSGTLKCSGNCVGNFGDYRIEWIWYPDFAADDDRLSFKLSLEEHDLGDIVPEDVDHPSLWDICNYLKEWKSAEGNMPAKHGGKHGYRLILEHFKKESNCATV